MQPCTELPFFTLLDYSVRGRSSVSTHSKYCVIQGIKQDKILSGRVRFIDEQIDLLSKTAGEFFKECFGDNVALIPVPRSSITSESAGLWPGRRICEELMKRRLGGESFPLVERAIRMRKSSLCAPDDRPSAKEHYDSFQIRSGQFLASDRILLVDDVITRGATLMGAARCVRDAYPSVPVTCFALARAVSSGEIDRMWAPRKGKIRYLPNEETSARVEL